MVMSVMPCGAALPGYAVPLDTLAALPKVRTGTADQLAKTVVKQIIEEHISVALQAQTEDEFVRASNEHLKPFLNKLNAFMTFMKQATASHAESVEQDGEEWNLAVTYFKRAGRVADRLQRDQRFRKSIDGDQLMRHSGAMCVASWLITCGICIQAGIVEPTAEVREAVERHALQVAKQAYHLLRDAEMLYSAPTPTELDAAMAAVRALRTSSSD